MSNRLYQSVIHQMKDAINRTVGIIDESGLIVACSDPRLVGESRQGLREELPFSNDAAAFDGFTYRFISVGGKNEGVVFVEGEDAEAGRDAAMLAVSLGNIKSLYDEKYDKGSFIKNIMLDNILPSDIYIKSRSNPRRTSSTSALRAEMRAINAGVMRVPPFQALPVSASGSRDCRRA